MFLDGLSFLEEERDAWRPFEDLLELSDAELTEPVEAAHGWSGRDLMGHLLSGQDVALRVAQELAVGETSTAKAAADADWEARGGEVVNAELQAAWAAVPHRRAPPSVRRAAGRAARLPDRRPRDHDGSSTPTTCAFLVDETLDHYEDHRRGPGGHPAGGRPSDRP